MLKEKVANKIVTGIKMLHQRWADMMQKVSNKIPLRKRKWMVILFVLGAGGYSLYLVALSISGPHRQGLHITSIKSPKYITSPGDINNKKVGRIPEHEYKKIQAFKNYMDSLGRTIKGSIIRDSIIQTRPGLLDSVQQIETIYQLQIKK